MGVHFVIVTMPFKRFKKISLALSKEGSMLLCLESFERDHKIKMAWKKIIAAHVLRRTSPYLAIVFHITEAKRGEESGAPQGLRSQNQNCWARLQEKNRCRLDSSLLKQIWHLEAMDHPLCLVQLSAGVFLCRRR